MSVHRRDGGDGRRLAVLRPVPRRPDVRRVSIVLVVLLSFAVAFCMVAPAGAASPSHPTTHEIQCGLGKDGGAAASSPTQSPSFWALPADERVLATRPLDPGSSPLVDRVPTPIVTYLRGDLASRAPPVPF